MAGEMVSFEYHMLGLANISKQILKLPKDIRDKVVRGGVTDAMKIMQAAVQERAERLRHTSAKASHGTHIYASDGVPNVLLNTGIDRNTGNVHARVGIRGGARYRNGDREKGLPTYWRYVEFGTSKSRAKPFMRPAMNENAKQVLAAAVNGMASRFERTL